MTFPLIRRRWIWGVYFFACVAVTHLTDDSRAAPVVKVKYDPGNAFAYTVSYSRNHSPDVFELNGNYSEVSLAVAAVERLRRWDASISGYDWRLAVILVEVREVGVASARPLQEYINEVAGAYRRARYARDWATQNVGKLTEQQFDQVNGLIDEYNRTLADARSVYPSTFNSYPTIPQIPRTWIGTTIYYGILYRSKSGGGWYWIDGKTPNLAYANSVKEMLQAKYGRLYEFRVSTINE